MRLALFASLILSATAIAPARAATRTFPVGGFDRVRSDVPFDVHVRTGGPAGAHAIGSDQILARLHVGVRNGELVIDADRGRWFSNFTLHRADRVVIKVTMPRIVAATLNGPGNMIVDAARAPAFSAALTGPGDLTIGMIEAGRADITLSGPGNITLAGKTGSAHILGRGPGDIRAAGWTVNDVAIELDGPGDVAVTALRTASVRLRGPGDVRISGHPHCQVSKSGPGTVVCGS